MSLLRLIAFLCGMFFSCSSVILQAASGTYSIGSDAQKSEEAKALEEAYMLYERKSFDEAKKILLSIYKTDPQKVEAKRLLGFIAFQEGEYRLAFKYLKDLKSSDHEMETVQAIVTLLNSKPEDLDDLFESFHLKELSPEIYFRLGFGSLIMDQPLSAIHWFEKAGKENADALAGRCYASFELNSWKETIDFFLKLPEPYKSLDGYQGIVIESYTSLGDTDKAERMLESLLKKPPQPNMSEFPDYFRIFMRKKLDQWNRYYIAALYYKLVKKDPTKALQFFNKIDNPSFISEVEEGELYLQLGKLSEARQILTKLLKKIDGVEEEKKIKMRILPLLGTIYSKLGFYPEALPFFQEYFMLAPLDDPYRIPFAQVLMHLQRYDLAAQQFQQFRKTYSFSPSQMLDYLECLVKLNQFAEVNRLAQIWIANKTVPILSQIRLCRLLIITQNRTLLEEIFSAIQGKEIKTMEENQALVLLLLDLGNYEEALSLADSIQRGLETTSEGMMVLARLNRRLSQDVEAIDYAENALALSPNNREIINFIGKFEQSPATIARQIKELKKQIELYSQSATLLLDYAKLLIDFAVETAGTNDAENISQSPDLLTAHITLEQLLKENPGIPEIFFLSGKTLYLLDKNNEAVSSYSDALSLDPSYVDALQYLALAHEEEGSLAKAVAVSKDAAKFDPSNAEVWLQLGGLLDKYKKPKEAVEALKNARKFAPKDSEAYIKIAEIYLELKNPDSAYENLEVALELSPKSIEAVRLILLALYDQNFMGSTKDRSSIEKLRLKYFDKLQALSPEDAKTMHELLGVPVT